MGIAIQENVQKLIEMALAEDIGCGDATTLAIVPENSCSKAFFNSREDIVVCGMEVVEAVFKRLDPYLKFIVLKSDGEKARAGETLAVIEGKTQPILTGERVSLNFLQRLSGIATLTSKYVEAIKGTNAKILDTRKTTPGWRMLEKYAVKCGGGVNHRIGLFEQILIKDNHISALRGEKPNPISAAVRRAREKYPNLKVEVEADTLEQVVQAIEAGADIILLDNMDLDEMKEAVKIVAGRAKTEASGGITFEKIRAVAETGVDFISVGAITHSARAVDIGLDFVEYNVK